MTDARLKDKTWANVMTYYKPLWERLAKEKATASERRRIATHADYIIENLIIDYPDDDFLCGQLDKLLALIKGENK